MIRIIHVDDNEEHFEIISEHLSKLANDIEIHWAGSADDAISALQTSNYSCILSDYQMPGKDGLELLRQLRGEGVNTPFIFLTGQGNENIAAEALREGADDYYTKDVGIAHYERLLNSIRNVVKAHLDRVKHQAVEIALGVEKAFMEKLFESAPEAIVLMDNSGTVLRANSVFSEMFGFLESEAIGRSIDSLIALGDKSEEAAALTVKAAGGENVVFESVRFRKDGQPLHVSILGAPVNIDGGQAGIYGIYRDITARKNAEEALRRSEEKYRSLFEHSKDVVFITSIDGDFLDINPSGARLFEYSREELLSMKATDTYVNPKNREEFIREIEEMGFVTEYPVNIRTKSGRIRNVVVTAVASKNRSGNYSELDGIIRDVTELRQAQEELRASEYKFRSLIENTVDGIVLLRGQQIEFANRAAAGMTGYSEDELLTYPVSHFFADTPMGRKLILDHLSRRQAGENVPSQYEAELQTKDGRIKRVLLSASLVQIGEETLTMAVAKDLSKP